MSVDTDFGFCCPKCGGDGISIEDKSRDDSPVRCANRTCGVRFDETWGQIKKRAAKQRDDEIAGDFGKLFKNGG